MKEKKFFYFFLFIFIYIKNWIKLINYICFKIIIKYLYFIYFY